MKVVAFLQCQWFKNPERVAAMYARKTTPEDRAALNRVFLFYRSLTGRRIKTAFGDDLCHEIIWEEASKKVAGKSDGVFPADHEHIVSVIRHFKPEVILCFGKIAGDAVRAVVWPTPDIGAPPIIYGPHPAARHATVPAELAKMATTLKSIWEL